MAQQTADAPECPRCGTEMDVAVSSSNITGWGCPECDLPGDEVADA